MGKDKKDWPHTWGAKVENFIEDHIDHWMPLAWCVFLFVILPLGMWLIK